MDCNQSAKRVTQLLLAGETIWFPLCNQNMHTARYLPAARQIASQCEWGLSLAPPCVGRRAKPAPIQATHPFSRIADYHIWDAATKYYCSVTYFRAACSLVVIASHMQSVPAEGSQKQC